jgi:hypothetical protein
MHLYCQSGTLVCKGVVTNKDIIDCQKDYPQFLEELLLENAPTRLKNVKKGAYHHKQISTFGYAHLFWHRSIPEPDHETDFEERISLGGSDGTTTVYVGDFLYEPNNEDLKDCPGYFEWVPSKNGKHAAKDRAMGLLYRTGGDTGTDIYYLKNDAKEIVALYLP